MPRPMTFWSSSMTTALVVVDPRSMPMKQRMRFPLVGSERGGALLLDHLQVALETVLHVRRRKIARVDQVGLDERRRLPGALLDLAQDKQLSCREAVATLDRVDQQAVCLVLVDILA